MLPSYLIEELQRMAAQSPQREICGFVSENLRIFPIRNIATTSDCFLMHKRDHALAMNEMRATEDEVKVIYHSHPYTPSASQKDLEFFRKSKADMLIVTPTEWSYYINAAH